jgi:glutathione S-transferase
VLWLLEELELTYEVKRYERDKKTFLAPPELKKLHPLGKSPIVTDGDLTLAESGAIIEYLVETYGKDRLAPAPGTPERRRYTYWMHYAEGSAMPPLLLKLVFEKMKKAPVPFFVKPVVKSIANKVCDQFVDPQLETHFGYVDAELGKHPWFAGDAFSAADVQVSFPCEAAAARMGGGRPNLTAFVAKIHERPAYKRALERGGPYELMS